MSQGSYELVLANGQIKLTRDHPDSENGIPVALIDNFVCLTSGEMLGDDIVGDLVSQHAKLEGQTDHELYKDFMEPFREKG